jgi:hypothetical protein
MLELIFSAQYRMIDVKNRSMLMKMTSCENARNSPGKE